MNRMLLAGTALCAALALPVIAEAASGFATANVNMRSGPSTAYPAVTMIPAGQPLRINGCLSETPWCDVSFVGGRGWVAGRYVQAVYQQRRVYVGPDYYRPLGIPTITFDLDNYWDRNYRGRDFYRDRDRWAQQGPDWSQNDGDPNWNRRRPPPPPRAYDGQNDDNQGNNWPRRGNWPRQPGYDNGDDMQGDSNPPPRPRYRQPYNDDGQQQDDYAPRQGDYRDNNNPPPRMPPRQQDQGQPRQQPQDQMQPPPGQPPRQQPQGQPRPPQPPPQPAPQQQQPAPQAQPQPAPPPQPNTAAPRPADNKPPRVMRGDQSTGPNAPPRAGGQACTDALPNCDQPTGHDYHR